MRKTFILILISLIPILSYSQLNIKYYLGAGRYALFKENFTEAINRFSKVVDVKPKYPEAYFLRGIAKYNLSDYLGAKQDFDKAIKINPFYSEAYHFRGIANEQLNDYNKAINDFEQALEMDPTKPMVYVHRGLTYLMNNKNKKARNDFSEALRLNPNLPEGYINRAIAFLQLKDTVAAIKDLNKGIKLNPFNAEAFRRRGLISYLKNKPDEAIKDYNRALIIDENNSLILYLRALAYYKKHNYKKSLNDYDKVIELDPDNALAIYNRALLKTEMGSYNNAIKDYNIAANINPNNILVYYNRAGVKIQLKDYKGAIKDYDKAIKIFPDFATAYINRSIVKQKLGLNKQAYLDQQIAKKIINNYKKKYKDTTYQAFRDTSQNLTALVDFNSEFKNEFTRNRIQNKNIQITLRNNYIIIPVTKDKNPFKVLFVKALFKFEKSNPNWKFIPDTWKSDTALMLCMPQQDSLTSKSTEFNYYSFAIKQSLQNNFYLALKTLNIKPIKKTWYYYFITGTIKAQMEEYVNLKNDYTTQIKLNEKASSINKKSIKEVKVNYKEPIEDLTRCIDLNNKFGLAYYNRANFECKSKEFKKAINDYSKSINLDENPQAYYNRGLTLLYLKETQKGCLDISKAGELGIKESYNVIKRYCKKNKKK